MDMDNCLSIRWHKRDAIPLFGASLIQYIPSIWTVFPFRGISWHGRPLPTFRTPFPHWVFWDMGTPSGGMTMPILFRHFVLPTFHMCINI